jgi:hypothetical protein
MESQEVENGKFILEVVNKLSSSSEEDRSLANDPVEPGSGGCSQ